MKDAGIISSRREGQTLYYSLNTGETEVLNTIFKYLELYKKNCINFLSRYKKEVVVVNQLDGIIKTEASFKAVLLILNLIRKRGNCESSKCNRL